MLNLVLGIAVTVTLVFGVKSWLDQRLYILDEHDL
jgi:hypothetical protein